MKKTINISLAGLSFVVEEDAYERLHNYLQDVRRHFSSYKEADEIVSDIESRFAEQFSAKAGNGQVINLAEVDQVIAGMGSPEQFGDQPQSGQSQAEVKTSASGKRYYRNGEDAIIAGVCSGLAAYIGVDPVWVRLVFALSVLIGGTGVLIYILLWIIVPEAKTETEKMQMRGEPITLKNLEETLKERAEEVKKNGGKFKNAASAPLRALGAVVRALALVLAKFFKVLVKIIGAALVLAAALGAAAVVFSAVTILFNANSPYIDFPVRALAHGVWYYAGIAAAFVALFLPFVALILLGVSIVSGHSMFKKVAGFSLLGVWIVAAAVAVNVGIRMAPQIQEAINSSPEYRVITRDLDVKGFTKIELNGMDNAEVHRADTYKVTVEGTEGELNAVDIAVENGTLLSRYHETRPRICIFCKDQPLHFVIYTPALDSVNLSGGSRISADSFTSDHFTVDLSGISRAELALEAGGIEAHLSGASSAVFSGTTTTMTLKETGSSRIDAQNLHFYVNPVLSSIPLSLSADLSGASKLSLSGEMSGVNLNLSGASRVDAEHVNAKNVDAELSGASKIYIGDILTLTTKLSGASHVYYHSVVQLNTHNSGASSAEQNPTDPSYEY